MMKRILHMIFESPQAGSALFRCLEVANPEEDSILLLEDAVSAVLTQTEILRSFKVFILEHDLQCRGLLHYTPPEWTMINDIQWVDQTLVHHSILRWI